MRVALCVLNVFVSGDKRVFHAFVTSVNFTCLFHVHYNLHLIVSTYCGTFSYPPFLHTAIPMLWHYPILLYGHNVILSY